MKQQNSIRKKNFFMKKLYYSISEVSKISDLEQYVLRYWETEFEQLKPAKNLAGNRIYTNKDIKLILYIKKLLRDEKYTIEGAKKLLKGYSFKEDSELQEAKPKNLKPIPHTSASGYKSAKELSLFTGDEDNQESEFDSETTDSKKLKRDLRELKNFLTNLLDDLD
jgi:DNA-binding transcriptional MerR regulator